MSSFPYTSNIPQATDNPSDSQPQILNNFQAINEAVSAEHVGFNNARVGRHNRSTYQSQGTSGDSVMTESNEGAVYTRQISSTDTRIGLFYKDNMGAETMIAGGGGAGPITPLPGRAGYVRNVDLGSTSFLPADPNPTYNIQPVAITINAAYTYWGSDDPNSRVIHFRILNSNVNSFLINLSDWVASIFSVSAQFIPPRASTATPTYLWSNASNPRSVVIIGVGPSPFRMNVSFFGIASPNIVLPP